MTLLACQASALPLSYAPINRIREGDIYSELFPKSTLNFPFPRNFRVPKTLALVGSSLVGGDYTPTGWEVKGKVWEKYFWILC